MKNNKYKKKRAYGVIRVGNEMFTVTGEEYAEYYRELERWKYIKRTEKGKKLSYERALEDGLPLEILSAYPSICLEQVVETSIMISIMLEALRKLEKEDQELIRLLFFEEISLRELARTLGLSLTTVFDRKTRILKKIKKIMGI